MIVLDSVILFKVTDTFRIKSFRGVALNRALPQCLYQILLLLFQRTAREGLNGCIQNKENTEKQKNGEDAGREAAGFFCLKSFHGNLAPFRIFRIR